MSDNTQITTPKTKTVSSRQVRLLTSTAIFAAMITLMTAYICHIPDGINGGYIHFGDGLIYIAATLLPAPYALAAAAIGGGLADLLTAPMWAPATIIIKMLITIPFTCKKDKIINGRNVVAIFVAALISGAGYFIANAFFMGGLNTSAGLFSAFIAYLFGGSLVQSGGSAIVFIVLGLMLDKMGFKKRFLREES
jgi:uncharacterized repeat protein (TIGR04002 family)